MKKVLFFILFTLLFTSAGTGQVTVTNPTNTTPNLAATYTSLANAITALNGITAISGPVVITLNAGNNQAAPAGGYIIQFTASTTAVNNITISGSNNTITASASLTAGSLTDGIFKIISADYITLENFVMQENAANTTTAAASNNMTEWGVALLHASINDGAQNNTIQNNTISLNRTYTNTFAIYSNSRHSATNVTLPNDALGTATTNNYNKIYGNTISNVNMGITFIGAASQELGNDIGGSAAATGNTITNWGGAAAASTFNSNATSSYCIFINHQVNENVSYNTITSAAVSGTAVAFTGIRKDYSTNQPFVTFTSSITNNVVTMTSGFASGAFTAILSQGLTGSSTSTLNINNNSIINCAVTAAGSGSSITGISNGSGVGTLNMNGNTIQGTTSTATTFAGFTGIVNTAALANCTININNNTLGLPGSPLITFSSASGGACTAISNIIGTTNTSININNNVIDGMNWVSGGSLQAISNTGGSGSTVVINNNTIRRLAVTGSGANTGIVGILNSAAATALSVSGNIINNNSSTATAFSGSFSAIQNSGAVVNTISINNNQIGNASGGALTFSNFSSGTVTGINNSGTGLSTTVNINGNSFDGFIIATSGLFQGIYNSGNPGVNNINNNQFGTATGSFITFTGSQLSQVSAIVSNTVSTSSTLTIQGNDIRGITHNFGGGCVYRLISCATSPSSQTISGNTFTNLTLNTTGSVYLISKQGTMSSGMTWTCTNNSIVTGFAKTGVAGDGAFIYLSGSSASGSNVVITGNNFSNASFASGTLVYGIRDAEGASAVNAPSKTITGNTITNITAGSTFWAILIERGVSVNCSSNTISNINTVNGGDNYGIWLGTNIGTGPLIVASNSINLFNCPQCRNWGIYGGSAQPSLTTISGNNISNFSTTGTSGYSTGINLLQANNADIFQNTVSDFSAVGADGATNVNGMLISGQNTLNIYRNKVHSLQHSGGVFGTVACVNGIILSGGVTVTAYNNFISHLLAPNATKQLGIIGLGVTSSTSGSTYNIYYNSVYVNASSTGANFGTAALYHTDNATSTVASLNLVNNIIVNTSIANGTGFTAAYQRSSTTLGNYGPGSNNNLFYAGVPSATNVIFYDGTNSDQNMAGFQTRIGTRESNSITAMPSFVSNTDLHLTAGNCQVDARATPLGAVTDDIDLAARDASNPDIGADEFAAAAITSLAGVTGMPVCDYKNIPGSGATFISNDCRMIATVVPSGASPLSMQVNTCVTLDATQQYFNGDPYVQRHFDIEPTVAPSTSTATITLYFNDADFALYNSNNPAWPPLPTAGAGNTVTNRNNVKVTQFHGLANTTPSSPGNYPGAIQLITPGAANVDWNGLYWTVTFDVTGFSGFYIHTNNFNAPLPIIVNYLTGRKQGSNHLLNWKITCNSTPRASMTLERSSDGRNYSGINTISADAARCKQPFDYTDINPLKGMNYYRLKVVDADGKVTYSTTVALLNAVKGFDIISIAPNPVVTDNFKLNVASATTGKLDVAVFDMQGRMVNRQTFALIAGFNSVPVNVASLSPGTYIIKAGMDDDQPKVFRFVKQ